MFLKAVTKKYDDKVVFKDFSLDIKEGEITCILGKSGCGKTTLLNMIADIVDYEGDIEGHKGRLSYIFQEPRLLPHLKVKDNLYYVGADIESVKEILIKTELYEKKEYYPDQLSGGEKQRVAFARAFLRPFDLLLMDEPFSSLDTAMKIRLSKYFLKLWSEFNRNHNRTAVFVTHNLDEALLISNRIIILDDGQVIDDIKIPQDELHLEYGKNSYTREIILEELLKIE